MYSAYTTLVGPAPRCCLFSARDWPSQRWCESISRAQHTSRRFPQPAPSKRQIAVQVGDWPICSTMLTFAAADCMVLTAVLSQAVQAPTRPAEVQPATGTVVLNSDVSVRFLTISVLPAQHDPDIT